MHVIRVFDALLAGRKSGRKLQCLRANPVTNSFFFFSNIDFAQRMNRKLFKGVGGLEDALVNF